MLLVNDESAVGRFNCAQRGFNNMLETLPVILVQYVAACAVCPRTSTFAVVAYGIGRVLFSLGYEKSAGSRQMVDAFELNRSWFENSSPVLSKPLPSRV